MRKIIGGACVIDRIPETTGMIGRRNLPANEEKPAQPAKSCWSLPVSETVAAAPMEGDARGGARYPRFSKPFENQTGFEIVGGVSTSRTARQ
ncbi:hypothetical protein RMSM_02055 [Rhodopirellula maiorica SM1]|uniref:Uncharacterized protein n=1 Tax=Rhodopirellula maiorica SM1 TaxID=1265738 RepID=M5RNY6_9BACT|nr:hypothetical protein RMSM_02055 [Rhodopirellula maiorica SM1]